MSKFRSVELSDPAFESDHLRLITVKSPALKGRGDISVFVPPGAASAKDLPVVLLLHGIFGSHWSWSGMGGAHKSALEMIRAEKIRPMVLVMPSDGLWGDGSGYVPHTQQDFDGWIMEDVLDVTAECIPCVSRNSPLFIAGLSMGGYGALRLGAKHARRFKAFSSHSGLSDLSQLGQFMEDKLDIVKARAGEETSVLRWMIKNRAELPPFRFDCGSSDILIGVNRELAVQLKAEGIPHQFYEFAGDHNWEYWREHIKESLLFFDQQLGPKH